MIELGAQLALIDHLGKPHMLRLRLMTEKVTRWSG